MNEDIGALLSIALIGLLWSHINASTNALSQLTAHSSLAIRNTACTPKFDIPTK